MISCRKPEVVIPVGRAARFHRAFEEASIRMPNTDLQKETSEGGRAEAGIQCF
jgi:hypothetical protein